MTDVPSNLIPTRLSLLPQYLGNDRDGSIYYKYAGVSYQAQLSTLMVGLPGTGTVTSVNVSGGSTGFSFSGGPITDTGSLLMEGTLALSHGGTGATTAAGARDAILPSYAGQANKVLTVNPGEDGVGWQVGTGGGGSGTVTSVDASGGTTGFSFTGGPITGGGVLTLSGTLGVANGGTNATTAAGARNSLLPNFAGNAGKVLAVNAGATDAEWIAAGGGGTVTSVDASGGSTGLSFSGGPIVGAGTLTLSGTLGVANGGTNATTAAGARSSLLPSFVGNAGKVLAVNAGATDAEWIASGGSGTVTSVDVSGGSTGLSFSGGPIVGAGTITMGGTLGVANGGTGITAFGTGVATALGVNVGSAGAFVTFNGALGTPSGGVATNLTGLPLTTGVTGTLPVANGGTGITAFGTGVATALGINVGSAGAFVTFNGAGGTPSAITLTNGTGLPISSGVSGLGTNVATFLGTPSSANLAAAVTDETGSGSLVFATSPTLVTPALGTPASGILTNCTYTVPSAPATNAVGFLGAPQMADQDDYTLTMADAGGHYYHTSASTHTLTIPANASVAFPIGTIITIVNENGGGNISLAITTDTLRWGSSTGTRTIAANGVASLLKVTSTVWRLTGSGIT